VFDLGGGTYDVSILDSFEGIMEVRGRGVGWAGVGWGGLGWGGGGLLCLMVMPAFIPLVAPRPVLLAQCVWGKRLRQL